MDDISGKLVESMVDKRQEMGLYQVEWEPFVGANCRSPFPSGIYFYCMTARIGHNEFRQGRTGNPPTLKRGK